jgi:predicted ATPase
MQDALKRHDDIVGGAIAASSGRVFKYVGDAVYAVFERADDAVAAALAAQLALHAEQWPAKAPIRVRIAINTGPALEVDDDYVGPTLNRTARLVELGHGGQTLLSLETRQELGTLPEGAELCDLGAHRLRDLARPERIYELCHEDLPHEFPPLRSLDAMPQNLPIRRSPFVGRSREMAEVMQLLQDSSLVTLVGAGGSGKSRLALQIAAELAHTYPDGVWFVPLESLHEAHLVPQRIGGALGIAEEPGRPVLDTIVDYVRPRRMLLILDNCEHLIEACAMTTLTLIEAAPDLHVLATSREAMDIDGEVAWRVPPMSLPAPGELDGLSAEEVAAVAAQYSAVRLFLVRAERADRAFQVTPDNARQIVEICRKLDGMPLAIELAAARVRVMSVDMILERLDDRFRLLTAGRRGTLPRQQTLKALIDWSHDLLSESERLVFRRLAVFRGGWTLEAAEAVCTGDPIESGDVLDLLTRLVNKSLVLVSDTSYGMRYGFLQTIQEYAWERLIESDELDDVHRRFVSWCLETARPGEGELSGPRQDEWLLRLDAERDNFRAALAWSTREAEGGSNRVWPAQAALALVGVLSRYWEKRGYHREGRARMARVLALPQNGPPSPSRAAALIGAGILACQQGDYVEARAFTEEGLAIQREENDAAAVATALSTLATVAHQTGDFAEARSYGEKSLQLRQQLGDTAGVAEALHQLGNLAFEQGDLDEASRAFRESLAMRRDAGDRRGEAGSLNALASVAYARGDVELAHRLYGESLKLARSLGDRRAEAFALNNIGRLLYDFGDTQGARSFLEESLGLKREMDDKRGIANSLSNLGDVALAEGDVEGARASYRESLALRRRLGDRLGMAESLEDFAGLALAEGRPEETVSWYAAAERTRQDLGAPLQPQDVRSRDEHLVQARSVLGDAAFDGLWASGLDETLEDVVRSVLD